MQHINSKIIYLLIFLTDFMTPNLIISITEYFPRIDLLNITALSVRFAEYYNLACNIGDTITCIICINFIIDDIRIQCKICAHELTVTGRLRFNCYN